MRRSSAKRSRIPGLTMSLSSITPSTWAPSATTSGVLPLRETWSTACCTATGKLPPCACTCARTASAAPLRRLRKPWGRFRSTPLMRVCAVKGTNAADASMTGSADGPSSDWARATTLRPSGVSSAMEASCAASASCAMVMPGAGTNSVAWRLPKVMVPVLSSSSTSTSPAASTARPEVAITLACIMRLMPATPMADNSPPIVVGIRQTSKATSTASSTTEPAPACSTAKAENGHRVTMTSRNTSVRPVSRIDRASSLGVF